jgi:ribonuclease J
MIGAIYRRGGNIIEEKRRLIHVSGHAAQEDMRIMVETANPKFVVPIHGEYRMLFRHKEFVKNHMGYSDENVVLIENGDLLELRSDSARVVERNEVGRTFIDSMGMSEIEQETVRQRKKLAYGGIISLVVTLDKKTRKLTSEPTIKIQGVAGIDPLNGTLQGARISISDALEEMSLRDLRDMTWLAEHLRVHLMRYIKKSTGTKTLVVPTIIEV